jgi:hypothetical protein
VLSELGGTGDNIFSVESEMFGAMAPEDIVTIVFSTL